MDGTHADHLAGGDGNLLVDAAPQELPTGRALAQELAGQVDTDHGVPIGQRHLQERWSRFCRPALLTEMWIVPNVVDRRLGVHGGDLVFAAGNVGT